MSPDSLSYQGFSAAWCNAHLDQWRDPIGSVKYLKINTSPDHQSRGDYGIFEYLQSIVAYTVDPATTMNGHADVITSG